MSSLVQEQAQCHIFWHILGSQVIVDWLTEVQHTILESSFEVEVEGVISW